MSVREVIETAVKKNPAKTYLYFKDEEISYQDFNDNINRVANGFLRKGIKKGDIVSLFLPNCPEFLYCWLALSKIGAIMVPINTAYKGQEAKYILNHSEAKIVVVTPEYLEIVRSIRKGCKHLEEIILVSDSPAPDAELLSDLVKGSSTDLIPVDISDDDLSCILYTSGTTGPPKGCMLPNDYYTLQGEEIVRFLKLTPDDRMLTCLPLFHMNAQTQTTMGSLTVGCSMILLDRFHAHNFWDDVRRYKATQFDYIGAMLAILYKLPETEQDRKHSVSRIWSGGCPREILEKFEGRFGLKIIEGYGLTESGTNTRHSVDMKRKIGSQGVPVSYQEVRVVDDKDRELPTNAIGEIVVRGKGLMKGYYKEPETTARALRGGWCHTGDNGYMDEDGYLWFVDREKDIIRRSGENISSMEVEHVIQSHPKVGEAAVIGVPDEIRGQEVKACIILKPGETEETLPPEEIVSFCEERLAYFKVPRYIEYREVFPRTPTQRVEKYKLRTEKKDLTEGCFDRLKTFP